MILERQRERREQKKLKNDTRDNRRIRKQTEHSLENSLKIFTDAISELDQVYDADSYLNSLIHQTKTLDFYYRNLKDGKNIETYKTDRPVREGDVVYVNLTRGYPMEQYDGHWCYVVRNFGYKIFIIPLCSVKAEALNSGNISTCRFNMYVNVVFDKNIKSVAKMSFSDMKSVDILRVDTRKRYGRLEISHERIMEKINQILD